MLLASGGFFSFGLGLVHALGLKDTVPRLMLLCVTNSRFRVTLLYSLGILQVFSSLDGIILHSPLQHSALPLERARSSSVLASWSSYYSHRRSHSRLDDCRYWARALCAYMGHNTHCKKTPPPLTTKGLEVTSFC